MTGLIMAGLFYLKLKMEAIIIKAFELEKINRFNEETIPAIVSTARKRVKEKLVMAGLEPLKRSGATGWFFEKESY